QTAHIHTLQSLMITSDPYRRGGTCLNTGQHRILTVESADLPAERRQRFAYRLDCIVGQRVSEVAQPHTRFVRGLDFTERTRRFATKKVTDQLAWSAVVSTAEGERLRLEALLQLHAGQRPSGEVLLRLDSHNNACIGVALVPGVLTHPVGNH